MDEIVITAILKPIEGHENEVYNVLKSVGEASRKETGCIQYDLHRSIEDSTYIIQEVWQNEEAVKGHINSTHYQEYRDSIPDFITSREVYKMKKLD
ncbi:putative quinol monooxygenase [Guptibacillus algicola]|uniref:putative quinol monooxygenase n=1 Tax=Guptibacillus algicola TaxID=225844 RepID=UPI001CD1E696|nr:putative quinol monooxygenase [Alkalihalobacillus algicola]MCA0988628.1 antibiotic biosynthesis monooxygenase [Alkalihalobacillus algicola]